MNLRKFLIGLGILAVVLTIVPYLSTNYWWARAFDFPHLQLTFLTFVAAGAYFFTFELRKNFDKVFMILLFTCCAFQLLKIFPYTALAPKVIADTELQQASQSVKLYTANVLQDNSEYDKVVEQIKDYDADILLLTETGVKWKKALDSGIGSRYKFRKGIALGNTYGMLMYSKLELVEPEILFQVSDSIPSIHTRVRLKDGTEIQFYAIHPTPPMPQHNPLSTDRDAEMMKIALKAYKDSIPIVVMGDFNDVAWSLTTRLFEQVSGLLDMRKGRGLYNTYNAKNPLLRWPLDHIFVSKEFRLVELQRGSDINSDHFPMYTEISLEAEIAHEQEREAPSDEELEDARKVAERKNPALLD